MINAFSSTACACAESDYCIVQSVVFLDKSFLSRTEIITGHRCMVKNCARTFWDEERGGECEIKKVFIRRLVLTHHQTLASF